MEAVIPVPGRGAMAADDEGPINGRIKGVVAIAAAQ